MKKLIRFVTDILHITNTLDSISISIVRLSTATSVLDKMLSFAEKDVAKVATRVNNTDAYVDSLAVKLYKLEKEVKELQEAGPTPTTPPTATAAEVAPPCCSSPC